MNDWELYERAGAYFAIPADDTGERDQLNGITQRRFLADLRHDVQSIIGDLHVFFFTTRTAGLSNDPIDLRTLPYFQNLFNLVQLIRLRRDDQQSIEQINGNTVRTLLIRSTDPKHALVDAHHRLANSLGDSSVRRHDQNRCHVALQRSIQEREALDVQHVHFVDEQHARNDLRFALLAPFGHLVVDLLANFGLDFARVAREQREESLRTAVDHVDFVQRDGVHHFFTFLQLAFGTLNKLGLGSSAI